MSASISSAVSASSPPTSAPTIYWHVGSKADLLAAVVEGVLTNVTVIDRTQGDWEVASAGSSRPSTNNSWPTPGLSNSS